MQTVFFPLMHRELIPRNLPAEVGLLDPGAAPTGQNRSSRYVIPSALPLNTKQAERFLAECLDFGERFQSPNDLHYFTGAGLEDYYSQTSMSIRSEFKRSAGLRQSESEEQEGSQKGHLQAQMVLLLAWRLEETLLDFQNLDRDIHERWGTFRHSLGLDEEEASGLDPGDEPTAAVEKGFHGLLPWPQLLIWFTRLLREECLLVVDSEILSEWDERGLTRQVPAAEELASCGLDRSSSEHCDPFVIKAAGWRLALLDGPDQGKPWLESERTVICCTSI